MDTRVFSINDEAIQDLHEIWCLIEDHDGPERADAITSKMEAFCFRLAELPHIGTRHDDRREGLRSVGIPGLRRATVLFLVTRHAVAVLRIGYLGRNVWEDIPI